MAKRLRIFFINCPSLAVDAAAFLILAQNKVQSAIQFEVQHFWIYGQTLRPKPKNLKDKIFGFNEDAFHSFARLPQPFSKLLEPFSRWLERKNRTRLDLYGAPQFQTTFALKDALVKTRTAITDYDDWLAKCGYLTYDTHRDPAIVITETALWGRYLSSCGKDVGVVSAAKWEDFFRPASGLEYVLNSIQRFSLRMLYGAKLGTHYPSRGCLWDFHVHQPDTKISSHLGFLCETCRGLLRQQTSPEEFNELTSLINNDWIGSESDSSSVAGILRKNYRYSLSRSSGLHPGVLSGISESMKSEFGKFVIEVVKWTLIVLITLLSLTYFPDATKKIRELINSSTDTPAPKAIAEPNPSPTPQAAVPPEQPTTALTPAS